MTQSTIDSRSIKDKESERRSLPSSVTIILISVAIITLLVLVFYNLTNFPSPWFDEGSHLHVPKSFVNFGVYADYSSEGFRYFGPSIGVGPTVMLPIAAMFQVFGVGLLQARLVMAVYLILALLVFYFLIQHIGGRKLALLSLILIVSTRSVLILETGRQVLGEVPGFLFLIAGLWLWFSSWPKVNLSRLLIVGLLLGLAMITKYQYLLFLLPTLSLAWILNIFYYRNLSHKDFLVPIVVSTGCFGLWGIFMLAFLGPESFVDNLSLLRESVAGAALVFQPSVMIRNFETLTSRSVYLGAVIPSLLYGATIFLRRDQKGQKWATLFLLLAINLFWFVAASIGWLRYAFLGLGLTSIFIAHFFLDVTDNFQFVGMESSSTGLIERISKRRNLLNLSLLFWLALIIAVPLIKTVGEIVGTQNPAVEMAEFLNETVPKDVIIETWEPEMGFLTDHNYHYPPQSLLYQANAQMYLGGEPVSDFYNYLETENPEYVLIGDFGGWIELYPSDDLAEEYYLIMTIGSYNLYDRIE